MKLLVSLALFFGSIAAAYGQAPGDARFVDELCVRDLLKQCVAETAVYSSQIVYCGKSPGTFCPNSGIISCADLVDTTDDKAIGALKYSVITRGTSATPPETEYTKCMAQVTACKQLVLSRKTCVMQDGLSNNLERLKQQLREDYMKALKAAQETLPVAAPKVPAAQPTTAR